jgi:hypothetical protein
MALVEKIHARVQELPGPRQAEVLDFIEYLLARTEQREARDWSALSLVSAMRGMEDENTPEYSHADLKVVFG